MTKPTVLIRADGSAELGMGHIVRSATLALSIRDRGGRPLFVSRRSDGRVRDYLAAHELDVTWVDADDAAGWRGDADREQLTTAAATHAAAAIVVDHYQPDAGYFAELAECSGVLGVIDDTGERDFRQVDWLLNQNLGAADLSYRISPETVTCLGTDFALIRPQFREASRTAKTNGEPPTLLVTLGGGRILPYLDPLITALLATEVDARIVCLLADPDDYRSAPTHDFAGLPNVTLESRTAHPERLFAAADLCITAGGSTCWELCCLGRPMIVTALADNQAGIAAALGRDGCAIDVGSWSPATTPVKIAEAAKTLLTNAAKRRQLGARAGKLIDGQGAARARRLSFDSHPHSTMTTIDLGSKQIGDGAPCFVVAEIGINHNGDMGLGREMIDAAVDAGADSVKFQNYRTEDFIGDRSLTYTYVSEGREVTESQYDMFKRCELSRDQLFELKAHCDSRGVIFHSTPTGQEGIDDLLSVDCPLLKNGSDYLTNHRVIEAMARTGLPTILSTGMATATEIDAAVACFRGAGGGDLILLLCTSAYPTPADQVNLRKLPVLRSAFDCLVGFSDHTWGTVAAVGSVIYGSCFVEKHFTINKDLPGPDHRFSSDPEELKRLVDDIRTIEANMGSESLAPADAELASRTGFRLSCTAASDLSAGHVLQDADIDFQRPGDGIPPAHAYLLVGRKLTQDLPAGTTLQTGHLE